jgi:hypothetical protein
MSRWVFNEDEYETGAKWFARWHRDQPDNQACAIDIDLLGYCRRCVEPLYLIEATRSTTRKTAFVLERTGSKLGVPVWVVYQDKSGRKPGEILVDDRSSRRNLGWLPEAEVWQMLTRIRSAHACHAS